MKRFTKEYVLYYDASTKTKQELRRDVRVCSTMLREWENLNPDAADQLYSVGRKATEELFKRYGDYAVWSTAYVNALPDSAFAWVAPGGKKDAEGKTIPRTLRKLPYKDKDGKIDLPHVRNALARLNQVKDSEGKVIPKSLQDRLRKTLEAALASAKKDMEEEFETEEFAVARVFGHPTGKMWLLKTLIEIIPEHKKFVEPFAGSATVYFGKKPEESAVLNDLGKYAEALETIKTLTDAEIKALSRKNWKSTPALFKKMLKWKPTTRLDRLYRFTWIQRFSYGCMGQGYDWTSEGMTSTLRNEEKWKRARERLQNATITKEDYKECIKKHDSPDTVFYLDPPYYDLKDSRTRNMGIGQVTIDDFIEGCKLVKQGKFFATVGYGNDWAKKLKDAGFYVFSVQAGRQVTTRYYKTHKKNMTVPIISNYPITGKQKKHAEELARLKAESESKQKDMEFTRHDYSETVEVHSVDHMEMSSEHPQWLELSGILFHRGMHKNVYYEDEALKSARLVPRQGEKLCYVNFYHRKDEGHRVGILAEIWWDDKVAWYCPTNNEHGKGALMYRSFITDKDAIAEIQAGKVGNVSAELHFDTYVKPSTGESKEYAAHVEVNGEAITASPALKAADIATVCTVDKDGNRSCKDMKKGQIK